MRSVTTVAAGMLLAGTMAPQALANQINTGGETGAYHASFCPQVETDVFAVLTVEGSLASRKHIGGTAPVQVKAAVARARQRLA